MNRSDLAAAIEVFGWGLLRSQDAGSTQANVFLSPTGLAFALGLLLNGSDGPTRAAIARTVSLSQWSLDETNETFLVSLDALSASDPKVRLEIANAVWADGRTPLDGLYVERCQRWLRADAQTLDFRSPDAVRAINDWVGRHTQGKIPTMVSDHDLAPPAQAVLTNAVYFYGPWTHPFVSERTQIGPFTLADGTTRRLPMMHQVELLAYAEAEECQAVRLPYGDERFRMDILLPKEGTSLVALVRSVSETPDRYTLAKARSQTVSLTLPRFSLEFQADLAAPLGAMGMAEAFGPEADFSAMGLPSGSFVGAVLHKTFLKVDEKGTEAAAATAVVMTRGMGPKSSIEMRVDRPFLCVIRDRYGMPLFVGAVYEPQAPEPTYEALVGQSGGRTRRAREQEALRTAVQQGDTDAVGVLLEAGANVNAPPAWEGGFTHLGEAAFRGHIEMVRFLLDRGADAGGCPQRALPVTIAAAINAHLDIVRLLLDRGADVDCQMAGGETALTRAALSGRTELVRLLAESGANLELKGEEGETALMRAVKGGTMHRQAEFRNTDTVAVLLEHGADPNAPNSEGNTPLMLAAQSGHADTVRLLLQAGARADAADGMGWTALHRAASYAPPEVVTLLLGAGADAAARDENGRDALWLAAYGGQADTARVLLEHGADPMSVDGEGVAAWVAATQNGHESTTEVMSVWLPAPDIIEAAKANSPVMVRRALEAGADPNAADGRATALMWATRAGRIEDFYVGFFSGGRGRAEHEQREEWERLVARETVKLLLEHGAQADAVVGGATVLSWGMIRSDPEVLSMLLDHGARVDAIGDGEVAPVLTAVQRDKPEAMRILLERGGDPNSRYIQPIPTDAPEEYRERVRNEQGTTALMWAAMQGRRATVELLLEFGADRRLRDERGRTAHDWAVRNGHGDFARILEI